MSPNTVDPDTLDARDIPHSPHSWSAAKRCIRKACPAGEHEWSDLVGVEDPPAYWRECRKCRIADVTAAAIGQEVVTPYANESGNSPK